VLFRSVAWQQRRTRAAQGAFSGRRTTEELKRLQEDYARSYSILENHEQACQMCQYVSKIGGLDFESLSSALNR